MKKTSLAALVATSLGVLVLAGYVLHMQSEQALEQRLPINTRLGGALTLSSTLGHPVSLQDWQGKVVLLDFGYTSCPDVCPTVLARLKQVLRVLGPDADRVQVVFVSIDPARDTFDHLRGYLGFFDPRMIGATGSEADIAGVTKRYGVIYMKQDEGSAAGYAYVHSDYIYLLDTKGRVRKLYDNEASAAEIKSDVQALLPGNFFRNLF